MPAPLLRSKPADERSNSTSSTAFILDTRAERSTSRRSTLQSSTEGHSNPQNGYRQRSQDILKAAEMHSYSTDSSPSPRKTSFTTDADTEKYAPSTTSFDTIPTSNNALGLSLRHSMMRFDIEKDLEISSRSSLEKECTFEVHPAVRPLEIKKKRSSMWETDGSDVIALSSKIDDSIPPVPPIPPELQTTGLGKWHEYLFVFTICMAQLFSLAALAQSFAPLLIISNSFGVTDPGQMSWYTAAYSMTLGTFILPAGRLGDMFGHKRIFMIGWAWFATWSMICGFSYVSGPIMLSICRGMQGIGPALLVPNGIALLGRTFPVGMKRAMAIAIFGGCGPVGVTLGVVFSSLFAQLVWWPWSFWAMAIACTFSGLLAHVVIPSDATRMSPQDATSHSRENFDILGAVTGVTGLLLIQFALNEAPVEGWNHVYIPVLLVLGFLLMAAFVYIELKAVRPIVPLRGLRREAAFTLACIAAGWASHGIWSYYMYLFIEGVRNHPPLTAAAETSPVALIGFCAAVAVPYILKKIKVPYLMSIAMLAFALSILFLLTAPIAQTYWLNTFLSILIAPFAMNWSFPSGTILMSNAVPKHHQGIAASLISTMVNYSIATGLGIGGTIARYTTPEQGVLGAYRDVWWLGVAFALVGFVISLYFIWQTRTRKVGTPPK